LCGGEVGIACFEAGGSVIDSGRKKADRNENEHPPTILFRRDFSENWRFVIVIPEAEAGLSRDWENEALRRSTSTKTISEDTCRLTLVKLLPCLIEEDIEGCGAALTEIERNAGAYFQEVQGGARNDGTHAPMRRVRSGAMFVGPSVIRFGGGKGIKGCRGQ